MNNAKVKHFLILGFITIFVVISFCIFGSMFNLFTSKNSFWDSVSATTTLSGDGSAENPYLIATSDDLLLLANGIGVAKSNEYNNKHYKQTQDIDMMNIYFAGIGSGLNSAITINYDGAGHYITGIQNGTMSQFGMFGNIQSSGIKNLHLRNVGITINSLQDNVSKNIGIFANSMTDSKITNCSVEIAILDYSANNLLNVNMGCFVGYAKDSFIYDCFCDSVQVKSQFDSVNLNIGLFAGKAEDCQISTCFGNGSLKIFGGAQNVNIGGFVGESNSNISDCYVKVSSGFEIDDISLLQNANVGGFVGLVDSGTDITTCYVLTTFINQDYSSKNVGLFAGFMTDSSMGFLSCYVIDSNNVYYDSMATFVNDASNFTGQYTKLASNQYSLASYNGFSDKIWKDNYALSKFPELQGVNNSLSDAIAIKKTDQFGKTKGYFESVKDSITTIAPNDYLYVLKEQITEYNLQIFNNLTITGDLAVHFIPSQSTGNIFVLSSGATLTIDGNFSFEGLQNGSNGFAAGNGTESLVLNHVSISGFACNVLINNLDNLQLNDSTIQNNVATDLITVKSLSLSKSTINQNLNSSNERTYVNIENQVLIDGYDNLLDISLYVALGASAKIQRTGLLDTLTDIDINSNIDIKISNTEDQWSTNLVLVQADQNLSFDNINYNLLNSPKFDQTNIDKFVLRYSGSSLLLGGQYFDLEYYDNQLGQYQRYYGKDMNGDDLPQIYEYGASVALTALQNANMQFVGWFGYDAKNHRYFSNNHNVYSNIYNNGLSSSTAINSIGTGYAYYIDFYATPNLTGSNATNGRFILYSKWQYNFVVEMQEETLVGENIQYVASLDAGTLGIDDSIYTTELSNTVSKAIFAGAEIKLTAVANANYTFIGWWQENAGVFTKYSKYQYEYNKNTNTYVLNISVADGSTTKLYARYIKNAYIINLQEVFKNEYNIETPIQIFSSNDQILSATVRRDGVDYQGKQYLYIIDNELVLRNNEKVVLQIDPKNYHLNNSQGKGIQTNAIQNNSFPSQTFNELNFSLTIENNVGSGYGSLIIYLEKNYHTITLKYGDNQTKDNFDGGDCGISETYSDGTTTIYSTFNHKTNQKMTYGDLQTVSKTANIYFGTSTFIYFNTQEGYRFDASNTFIQDELGQNVEYSIVKENNVPKAILISNVTKDIEVFIHFYKTYNVQFSLGKVDIGGAQTQIGEIQIESDDWTTDNVVKIVDKNNSIEFKTRQTSGQGAYQFVKWIITSDGQPVDYAELGLTETDLLKKNIVISSVDRNLEIKAFYNNANVKVSIIWNGKNAQISNVNATALGNDSFEIEYGQDMMLTIHPKTQKYFIKKFEVENGGVQVDTTANADGSTNYVLRSVLANTRVLLEVVPDSWLEHLEETKLEGDGTKESPYIIRTPSELQLIAQFVNSRVQAADGKTSYNVAYYKLANNIDLGEDYYFVPIGTSSNPFNGTFDYDYYAIKNLNTEPEAYLIDNSLIYIMGKDGKVINQFRSSKAMIISCVSIAVTVIVASVVVFVIEKRRKRPKKVFIINEKIPKE